MLRDTTTTVKGDDKKDSLSGLPDFVTEDREVSDMLVEWQTEWVEKYDIDYYRVDTVKHADDTTWKAFKNELTKVNPEFKMIGEYAGSGSWLFKDKPNEVVIQDGVFSRVGCERVIRYAFELAKKEGKSVTSISKANALNYSMVFWDQIFEEIGKEYPEVKTYSYLVDAASMFMVKDPKRFEIVVTSNLFGDILTDLGAAIAGGMGLAAGANINPERKFPSMFEPIHGSAPDIAGQGKANPLATILSAAMMLQYSFDEKDAAKAIEDAVDEALRQARTPDIYEDGFNKVTTSEMGDLVVSLLK